MKNIIITIFLASTLLSCTNNDDSLKSKDSCSENVNAQTIVHNNQTREYVLYVPNTYDGTSPVPVVMNFHGFGGNATDFINETKMRALSETETFILVYPQGSCLNGSSHWNPSLPGGDNKSTADDYGFIEALINDLETKYNINQERIYACGYSNGGMFAYGLAQNKSNLIAAIGSVSGAMIDTTPNPSHPMPLINIHGTNDGVLPYEGSNDYNSIQSTLNYWINFNETESSPTINSNTNNGVTIEKFTYGNGKNKISIEHYKVINGEHVWFDIDYEGANTDKLIWDFVSRYNINGLR
jgi:polyhydroxybutyrate depolymerase